MGIVSPLYKMYCVFTQNCSNFLFQKTLSLLELADIVWQTQNLFFVRNDFKHSMHSVWKTRGNNNSEMEGCGLNSRSVSFLVPPLRVRALHVKCFDKASSVSRASSHLMSRCVQEPPSGGSALRQLLATTQSFALARFGGFVDSNVLSSSTFVCALEDVSEVSNLFCSKYVVF